MEGKLLGAKHISEGSASAMSAPYTAMCLIAYAKTTALKKRG